MKKLSSMVSLYAYMLYSDMLNMKFDRDFNYLQPVYICYVSYLLYLFLFIKSLYGHSWSVMGDIKAHQVL